MKLSLFTPLLALSTFVLAEDAAAPVVQAEQQVEQQVDPVEIVTDPNFVPTPEKPFNFQIDYTISFKESDDGTIADLYNGETIELAYTFSSLEPAAVSILGVGGEMLDPVTGENMANITASQIGPIEVLNNATANFTQRVGINMQEGKYLLVPALYIVYQDQFMMLGSKNKIINILEPSISFFNPQLILSELILLITFGSLGYYLYNTFAASYLSSILPSSLLPADKKRKSNIVQVATKKVPASSLKKNSTSTSTSVESSWLPDTHKTITKKQKKKL